MQDNKKYGDVAGKLKFVDCLKNEEILSKTNELGTVEFLCLVFPYFSRLVMVLPA